MPRQKRPQTPAAPRGGRRPRFDISAAPEPFSPPSGGREIASGHHPYFCRIEPDGYAVVFTELGIDKEIVERGFKTPREALDRMTARNGAIA